MKKATLLVFVVLLLLTLGSGAALASGKKWADHAAPFDFLFGNHIDTHQQTQLLGQDQLQGFFYIQFTGEHTPDGYPIATHVDCTKMSDQCTVGWNLHGIPVEATLVEKEPEQHPVWCVNAADLPKQKGYSHFHWLGAPAHAHELTPGDTAGGYLLKLTARDSFFFDHHGGFLVTPGLDTETHANVVTNCDS